ncbi:HmuY family protein [Candidatus Poribacteria bacterium]|nr:HmuY family protein [Candidatus Poribacteria bacterium]
MDRIKEHLNWNIVIWFMLFLGVFIFFSCVSVDESEVEKILADSNATDETSDPSTTTDDLALIDEPVGLEAHTFTIDATNREEWVYFSFQTGGVIEIADAENSEDWDIGFQITKVKLNGGISGPGMGSVVMLTDTTFEDVTVAPEDGYRADTEDTLAIVPQSEKGWYIYTGPPTHWILPLEDRVFVVKGADGTFAKIRFIGYYKDNENKQDSGFVTFEYVHQPDGSRNF